MQRLGFSSFFRVLTRISHFSYAWKRAYETIWGRLPYKRINEASWKREYVDRWRNWRRWQFKHPSAQRSMDMEIGDLSCLQIDVEEMKVNVGSLASGCGCSAHRAYFNSVQVSSRLVASVHQRHSRIPSTVCPPWSTTLLSPACACPCKH